LFRSWLYPDFWRCPMLWQRGQAVIPTGKAAKNV
jgi:hypothetical protein